METMLSSPRRKTNGLIIGVLALITLIQECDATCASTTDKAVCDAYPDNCHCGTTPFTCTSGTECVVVDPACSSAATFGDCHGTAASKECAWKPATWATPITASATTGKCKFDYTCGKVSGATSISCEQATANSDPNWPYLCYWEHGAGKNSGETGHGSCRPDLKCASKANNLDTTEAKTACNTEPGCIWVKGAAATAGISHFCKVDMACPYYAIPADCVGDAALFSGCEHDGTTCKRIVPPVTTSSPTAACKSAICRTLPTFSILFAIILGFSL